MTNVTMAAPTPGSWPMIRALGGVGILCSLLIVLTFQATLPTIERNKAAALEKAIYKVLPGAQTRTTFLVVDDRLEAVTGEVPPGADVVFAGYGSDGRLIGVAVEAAGQGFQDVIRLLYGYAPDRQQVIGMEILESRETPGLGDKIFKDAGFVANFAALDVALDDGGTALAHPVVAVKSGTKENAWEVDGITGATISSVAVADIVRLSAERTLPLLRGNLTQLSRSGSDDDGR